MDLTGKLACCRLRLSEFEFYVDYRTGIKPQAFDALSRLEQTGTDQTPIEDDIGFVHSQPSTQNIGECYLYAR